MGMVKAFSYGSGSVEIASVLQYHNTDCLAVAYADEGKELRMGGIHLPIIVMNPEVPSFDTLLAYNLEPEIYSLELLNRFAREIDLISQNNPIDTRNPRDLSLRSRQAPQPVVYDRSRSTTHPIHIKLDTGMHRLGFQPDQLPELIDILQTYPAIRAASVFSHFAASDDPRHDEFSRDQISTFNECCNVLEKKLGYFFSRHMCNSAATTRFPEAHFDMVRLGIGLYGISKLPQIQDLLQHVSTFKSVISQVKHVFRGQTIGYDRNGIADKDMHIAIVPVGYADGLRRMLGNGNGSLIVAGQKRPIIGNISMDMCAIDVTGTHAKAGDEVIVFGKERSVNELARDMDTIPYEVLTSVSHRVKRVYYQG